MIRPLALALFAFAGLLAALPADACTVTLSADGNTAAIQHAMDRPGPPPVVCLRPGLYKGARLVVSRSVTLKRVGKDRVILHAGGQGRVLTVTQDGVNVTLEGLTLTEGKAQHGGAVGLLQNAKLTLRDCWLTANSATLQGGGAIAATSGQLELVRTRVTHNTAEHAAALDLSGNVKARLVASLVADNESRATGGAPVRLSGNAALEVRLSTIGYNSGNGIFLQPEGPGLRTLRLDSSIVMGQPEAISVQRAEAERVTVVRSVIYGGLGFVPTDMATTRGQLPGFNLTEAERYRPKTGSPAIELGRCGGKDSGTDLAGLRRPAVCTAGALEAPAADVRATVKQRAKDASAKEKAGSPW